VSAETRISTTWFRRLVLPASHRSWHEAELDLLSDDHERKRVSELEAELRINGFQRAVVLERDNWWSFRWRVRDGVHRSVAALRLGHPILIRFGFDTGVPYDHPDVYQVSPVASLTDGDAFIDSVLSLSSFRCSSGVWVQSDGATASRNGPMNVFFSHNPQLRNQIAAEFEDRLNAAGVGATVCFLENQS